MTEQLQLPYEEIKTLAGRNYMRSRFTQTNRVIFRVPFNEIQLRDGFIKREEFNEVELAELILAEGQKTPFDLDVLEDGRVFLSKGRRRYAAYQLLIKQGRIEANTPVPFLPIEKSVTELDRMVDQYTYNHSTKEYTPLEQAAVAWSVKNNFSEKPKPNEDVAALFKVSRQTVDNWIKIAEAPDDIKNEIRINKMGVTAALAFIKVSEKVNISTDKAEEKSHTTEMYTQPGYVDPLAGEMKELEALEEQAEDYKEQQAEIAKREQELLEEKANLVPVNKEALEAQQGKRLAANVNLHYFEKILNEETGELVDTPVFSIWAKQGSEINELFIEEILKTDIKEVWVFKNVTVAESVFTELPAEKERPEFDESRIEIQQAQNCIKLSDRISVRIEKLEISEGDKKDITDWVKWLQKDLLELRDWVKKHKPQNKMR